MLPTFSPPCRFRLRYAMLATPIGLFRHCALCHAALLLVYCRRLRHAICARSLSSYFDMPPYDILLHAALITLRYHCHYHATLSLFPLMPLDIAARAARRAMRQQRYMRFSSADTALREVSARRWFRVDFQHMPLLISRSFPEVSLFAFFIVC